MIEAEKVDASRSFLSSLIRVVGAVGICFFFIAAWVAYPVAREPKQKANPTTYSSISSSCNDKKPTNLSHISAETMPPNKAPTAIVLYVNNCSDVSCMKSVICSCDELVSEAGGTIFAASPHRW